MTSQQTPASPRPITRRTVAKGVAWSAPAAAMSIAAPALALSKPPCASPLNGVLSTHAADTFTSSGWSWSYGTGRKSASASTWATTSDSSTTRRFAVTLSTTTTGSAVLENTASDDAVEHFGRYSGTFSGLSSPIPITNETTGSRSRDLAGNYAHRQTTCITFAVPVYNLNLQIGDIDSYYGTSGFISTTRYRDAVAVRATLAAGATITPVSSTPWGTNTSTRVIGKGTVADPYRRPDSYLPATNDPWSSSAGTVTAGFGPDGVTSVCVDYWSGEGGGLQVVLLHADFRYCP